MTSPGFLTGPRFSNQLALSVKDRVRSVQFGVRRRALNAPNVAASMQMIPRPVAQAADAIMRYFEFAAVKMLPDGLRQSGNFIFPASISTYFQGHGDEIREFTPEIYFALKALMRRFSGGDCLVSETLVEAIHIRMKHLHHGALDEAMRGDPRGASAACGALAAEIAALRPIRAWILEPHSTSAPRHFFLAPNQYVAFVVGLAIAVKSRGPGRADEPPLGEDDIVTLVDLAVDARFSELSAAITSRNPVERLTQIFAEMSPFIA